MADACCLLYRALLPLHPRFCELKAQKAYLTRECQKAKRQDDDAHNLMKALTGGMGSPDGRGKGTRYLLLLAHTHARPDHVAAL